VFVCVMILGQRLNGHMTRHRVTHQFKNAPKRGSALLHTPVEPSFKASFWLLSALSVAQCGAVESLHANFQTGKLRRQVVTAGLSFEGAPVHGGGKWQGAAGAKALGHCQRSSEGHFKEGIAQGARSESFYSKKGP
jgi:hypothetical protein